MRIAFRRLSVVAGAIGALGLAGVLAASASAESIECKFIASVRLSPGLTEQPQVQHIRISGGAQGFCDASSEATPGTEGREGWFHAQLSTAEPVTCAVLKGPGAPSSTSSRLRIQWVRGFEGISLGTLTMPFGDTSVSLGGMITDRAFKGDAVSGTATEQYAGAETCGASPRNKVRKGEIRGAIKLS
jgi:hypothetical protein